MIDEPLTDRERYKVLWLAMQQLSKNQGDDDALLNIIRKVTGTDTVVICRRAYPSRTQEP